MRGDIRRAPRPLPRSIRTRCAQCGRADDLEEFIVGRGRVLLHRWECLRRFLAGYETDASLRRRLDRQT